MAHRAAPGTAGSGRTGLLKGPKVLVAGELLAGLLDTDTSGCRGGKCFPASLPSVLHTSQAQLGKGSSQLQRFLKAAHVLAGGLGRHILATTFTVHQA